MDITEAFLKLIKGFAQKGHISEIEITILKSKANEIGIESDTLDSLIGMELLSIANINTSDNNKQVEVNADENRGKIRRKIYEGKWWSRSGGLEDVGFGGLTIASDDAGGYYDLRWMDKDRVKIKIEAFNIEENKIEMITEIELFEIKNDSFHITTKDVLFILENIHEDQGEWDFEEQSLKKELIIFFDKFLEENVKIKNEVDGKIENIKRTWNRKRNEKKLAEKKEIKTYEWKGINLSSSTIDEKGTIVFWMNGNLDHVVIFRCLDLENIVIQEGYKKNAEWEFESLEKGTEIELIEFTTHTIKIKTTGSHYTFSHYLIGGGEFMELCKNYFPTKLIIEDPEIEVNVRKWQEEQRQTDEKYAREDEEREEVRRNEDRIAEEEKRRVEETNCTRYQGISNSKSATERKTEKCEFTSAVTRGGDIINPDKIIIDSGKIIWKKRSKILIGGESISIPIDKVSSVELDGGIVGTDIIIKGNGYSSIHAKDFTKSDAQKIKNLLGF